MSVRLEAIAKPALVALAVAVFAELFALARRRPEPRVVTDTSSLGPLEPIGPIGNTSPDYVLQGRPGEVPNIDVTLPVWFGWP